MTVIPTFYDKNLDERIPNVYSYAQIGKPIVYAESYEQRLERTFEYATRITRLQTLSWLEKDLKANMH